MAFLCPPVEVTAGEINLVPVSFASRLQPGETLVPPAAAALATSILSLVPDANAPNLVLGTPLVVGSSVQAFCGGLGPSTYLPGAIYSLFATVTTSLGQVLTEAVDLVCESVVPATASGSGMLPLSTTTITQNTTASQSTVYILDAPNLTLTLPSSWSPYAGAVTVADNSGTGGTVAGTITNWPVNPYQLVPNGSATFWWAPAPINGWVSA